jgi:4-diphosphocytidyl-2-C-methyl-D-erythritol kinase
MDRLPKVTPNWDGTIQSGKKAILIPAPAKINLFLKVLGKRPDGYHDIFSWFQALDLCDYLEIAKSDGNDIEIETDVDNIPTGPDNLVYQAAMEIRRRCPQIGGLKIRLWKRIPVGAGLGGGSSDAASLLKGINRLFDLGLDSEVMEEMGLKSGSDVPFFFSRGQAEVTGRGEIVNSIELPTNYRVALVTPPFEIRAAEAYRKLRLDLTAPLGGVKFKGCRQARELIEFISGLQNDLERALRESYPILDKIGEKLTKTGADIVRLSGSGPTMFALYGESTLSEKKLRQLFRGEAWGLKISCPIVLPA